MLNSHCLPWISNLNSLIMLNSHCLPWISNLNSLIMLNSHCLPWISNLNSLIMLNSHCLPISVILPVFPGSSGAVCHQINILRLTSSD